MRSLELVERETIIIFNEKEPNAEVFTYSPSWQKHFKEVLGIKPTKTKYDLGGKCYIIPKSRIKLPRPKKQLSDETKKRMVERLARSRI